MHLVIDLDQGGCLARCLLVVSDDHGLTWDDDTLDKFLTKPKKFLKGTKMGFPGLKKDDQRADVIAYLKSLK